MTTERRSGFGVPGFQFTNPEDAATKLVQADKPEDFITMLDFQDAEMASLWNDCVDKCLKYGLKRRLAYYYRFAQAQVARQSLRAKLFSQTVVGVPVPEFFGGHSDGRPRHGDRQRENT